MPSELMTAMMTVGSVLGKQMLEMVPRVAHGARSCFFPPARSVGGHTRLVPALTDRLRSPHWAQKGFRVFQSRRLRACAYIAAMGDELN